MDLRLANRVMDYYQYTGKEERSKYGRHCIDLRLLMKYTGKRRKYDWQIDTDSHWEQE